ncbi:VAMP-like protein YKT61 [Galdieria sulphuraria]|uniref:Synaptobrevin homolog YKT6 n=1 Tax=Galdieria sulphuraria TaxID=130081 RepID=M2WYZ3_GALSU|nr:synaptobrevin homolog YKT6 [Galdieria sulphuraria]EME29285.1 synaptobrevin homolog YKT6 [Galdieria sulphuraria]GJD05906.1 VAMP-like protein YKT61 [Galdieria sulphuraria]|eukprot:XP_005705805.1 synaptobrevin homolog YKT6 [Galdieria sulphuraria]
MKIIALFVLRKEEGEKEPFILSSAYHLNEFGYFQRNSIREFANFFAKTLVKRVPCGERASVEHQDTYVCHVYNAPSGLATVVLCDKEYPRRVAFTLLGKVIDEFTKEFNENVWKTTYIELTCSFVQKAVDEYQDPAKADSIVRIQKDLDETKIILHKTIDSVLERGTKLDALVEKSNDLSMQSKMFYRTARKQNSCCGFM